MLFLKCFRIVFIVVNILTILFLLIYIIYLRYISYVLISITGQPQAFTSNRSILYNFHNSTNFTNRTSKLCPMIPFNLIGRIPVDLNETTMEVLESNFSHLNIEIGGEWRPIKCKPRYKVAIVVPYRQRPKNLVIFLRHMHPFLMKQNIHYSIFVVEPVANLTFNRGILMNIGYIESLNHTNGTADWDCFMFHDVDLLPEDDRNIYSCPEIPRHMSSAVSTLNYRLPYDQIFGGVSSLTKQQMKKVNGFSNLYFGWGGEDDDFRARIVFKGFKISRYPLKIGRYHMQKHTRDQKINPKRFQLLKNAHVRIDTDGISTTEYKLIHFKREKLYTHIKVKYDQDKISKGKI